MLTRRQLVFGLAGAAAIPAFGRAQSFLGPFHKKAPVLAAPVFVYFGTDTDKGISKGIYLSRFDPASGRLTDPVLVAATVRPTFLAMAGNASERHMYAVNSGSGAKAAVSSFAVEAKTGALKPINQVPAEGDDPCYIAVDATGHAAYIASYMGSDIASYRILPSGGLSTIVDRVDFKDPKFGPLGPNSARQNAPHPHATTVSPDNRFLLVNDLGDDRLSVFPIDPLTAKLGTPALFSNDRPGAGPRHIAFHPNGRWVYGINELDSTIDRYLWTTTSSRTAPQGLLVKTGNGITTLAADYPAAKNTAAEVAVSSDGHFVYASNRGENSLVAFAVSPADGALTFLQRIPCGGKGPRHFTLDPTGHWVLCGNQDSASVTVFRRDEATGKLGGPVQTLAIDSPMFSLFA